MENVPKIQKIYIKWKKNYYLFPHEGRSDPHGKNNNNDKRKETWNATNESYDNGMNL